MTTLGAISEGGGLKRCGIMRVYSQGFQQFYGCKDLLYPPKPGHYIS